MVQTTADIRHLNQVDLSRRLGISVRTLERWRWSRARCALRSYVGNADGGMGPRFIKIGGRVKYRLEDVEAFEESRLCQSTADEHYFC